MKIELKSFDAPTQPGQYFFKGRYSGTVDFVTVYLRSTNDKDLTTWGIQFDPYLAVLEFGHKNVQSLKGVWSEQITF